MGTAAVIPMGRANHSERPVPKRPPFSTGAGAVSLVSSSRGAEAWNAIALGAATLFYDCDCRCWYCCIVWNMEYGIVVLVY